jgi:hypothetical protein
MRPMSFVEGPDATVLAARLTALLPGVGVRARPAGSVRRFLRASAARIDDVALLDVDAGPEAPPLRVRVPDHPDLRVAGVAEVIATTVEVRQAFGRHASHITEVSFDLGEPGFKSNRVAGTAYNNLGHFHINAGLVLGAERPMRYSLAGTTAHECWHQIEHVFELRRFAESVEFRRILGNYFGVETLERVLTGNERGAPMEQRIAFQRLGNEVSAYATTRRIEATAEMMKIWWCSSPPQPPIATLFGQLMGRFFGVHRD